MAIVSLSSSRYYFCSHSRWTGPHPVLSTTLPSLRSSGYPSLIIALMLEIAVSKPLLVALYITSAPGGRYAPTMAWLLGGNHGSDFPKAFVTQIATCRLLHNMYYQTLSDYVLFPQSVGAFRLFARALRASGDE